MTSLKFSPRPRFIEEFLIVDGIARAGKLMLGNVVSTLERVDFLRYIHLLDSLPYLHRLGKIETETARAMLRNEIDFSSYDRMIGRDLNGRVHDLSCIYRAPDFGRYLARAVEKDDRELVRKFLEEKRLLQFITHASLAHAALLFDVFPKAKIIHILRDPVALVESWRKRGWGRRFGTDPKSMNHAFEGAGGPMPWFATGWEKDYHAYNESERIVRSISALMEFGRLQYQALPSNLKARIVFAGFDELAIDPRPTMKRLSRFTGCEPSSMTESVLRRERLPRDVDKGAAAALRRQVSKTLPREGRSLLNRLAEEYADFWRPLARGLKP